MCLIILGLCCLCLFGSSGCSGLFLRRDNKRHREIASACSVVAPFCIALWAVISGQFYLSGYPDWIYLFLRWTQKDMLQLNNKDFFLLRLIYWIPVRSGSPSNRFSHQVLL